MCGAIGGGDEAVVGEGGLGGDGLDEGTGVAAGDAGVGREGVVVAEDGGGVGVAGDDPGLLDGAPVDGVVEAELAEDAVRVGPGFVDGGVEGGLGGARGGGTWMVGKGLLDEGHDVALSVAGRGPRWWVEVGRRR